MEIVTYFESRSGLVKHIRLMINNLMGQFSESLQLIRSLLLRSLVAKVCLPCGRAVVRRGPSSPQVVGERRALYAVIPQPSKATTIHIWARPKRRGELLHCISSMASCVRR